MNQSKRAYKVYLFYSGTTAFLFSLIFTVSQVYRLQVAHLNAFQLVIVGTVLELTCFLFEIPTGILADIKSRKISVIIGLILIGVAFFIEGSFPIIYVIIGTQVIWGIGATFISGADEAWIADEVKGENLEHIFLRAAQIGQVFSVLGILMSTLIGSYRINLPMLIGGGLFILLGILLIKMMKETEFQKTDKEDRNTYQQMIHTFSLGLKFIKTKPILMIMISISLLYGLYSEGLDRLWQPHFINDIGFPHFQDFKPIVWIGLINAIVSIISIVIVEIIKRNLDKKGKLEKVYLLFIVNLVMVISILVFALSRQFELAIIMYFSFFTTRAVIGPIYRAWMNQQIASEVRSTVLSTYGQLDALGQIIGGLIIGYIALHLSITIALFISGIILAPTILLYYVSYKKLKKEKE